MLAVVAYLLMRQGVFADRHQLPTSYAAAQFDAQHRPSTAELLYDYAGLLTAAEESVNRYLTSIKDNYQIEAIIVTLKHAPSSASIEDFAASLMSAWKIGKSYGGRGVLLILLEEQSAVKLEVSYELEDVFTDLFTGHIEDKQLRPHLLGGSLGTGLVAVMEELEHRAQIKHLGSYTKASITELDRDLLSGGGGAVRDLESYAAASAKNAQQPTPNLAHSHLKRGGDTPLEAFKIMADKWSGKHSYPERDIYTELTKAAYASYGMGTQDAPDARTRDEGLKLASKTAKVNQRGRYALVHFGETKGWDNSPFMFFQTDTGWKFDIASQRKYVTMGPAPIIYLQWADHGYAGLFGDFQTTLRKDLHLPPELVYDPADDPKLALEIDRLTSQVTNNPRDAKTLLELARLHIVASSRPNEIHPRLTAVKQLDAENPLPFLYGAVNHIDAFFQYKTAVRELEGYFSRAGETVISLDLLGFAELQIGNEDEAIAAFERSIKLHADNCYALCKLAECHAQKARKHGKGSKEYNSERAIALSYLNKAKSVPSTEPGRTAKLERWLSGPS